MFASSPLPDIIYDSSLTETRTKTLTVTITITITDLHIISQHYFVKNNKHYRLKETKAIIMLRFFTTPFYKNVKTLYFQLTKG